MFCLNDVYVFLAFGKTLAVFFQVRAHPWRWHLAHTGHDKAHYGGVDLQSCFIPGIAASSKTSLHNSSTRMVSVKSCLKLKCFRIARSLLKREASKTSGRLFHASVWCKLGPSDLTSWSSFPIIGLFSILWLVSNKILLWSLEHHVHLVQTFIFTKLITTVPAKSNMRPGPSGA